MPERRTAIFRRRALPAPPPIVHEWPTFLVSAPHRARPEPGVDAAMPYGPWHARRPGSLQSACGLPAVTWIIFWTLSLEDGGPSLCPRCRDAIRALAAK